MSMGSYQNNVSQSEDVLHQKLNYIRLVLRFLSIFYFFSVSIDEDRIQQYLEFVGLTNILDRVGMDTETDWNW